MVTRVAGLSSITPNGVYAPRIDLAAALSIGAALGYDTRALAELLPAAAAGIIAAVRNRFASEATP